MKDIIIKRLIGDRALVDPEKISDKTKEGLILIKKRVPREGSVIMIGNASPDDMFDVGDTVFFRRYTWKEIKYGGKKHFILDKNDIFAKRV